MFDRATPIDLDEGVLAYERYHIVMRRIAEYYTFPLERVVACFVSLSPNSDYAGNLRSTVSVLDGIRKGIAPELVTVSTYGHCKRRAHAYAIGAASFLNETKGPKIRNFYMNILQPKSWKYVTVDGHMSAIWQGKKLTMREALIPARTYKLIHADIAALAFKYYMLPNQMQAVLWFTRKRVENVVYDPQLKLFASRDDVWETLRDVSTIRPYPMKGTTTCEPAAVKQKAQASSELFARP
jgi:hypothetical protein